jgi:hypothetical protein
LIVETSIFGILNNHLVLGYTLTLLQSVRGVLVGPIRILVNSYALSVCRSVGNPISQIASARISVGSGLGSTALTSHSGIFEPLFLDNLPSTLHYF